MTYKFCFKIQVLGLRLQASLKYHFLLLGETEKANEHSGRGEELILVQLDKLPSSRVKRQKETSNKRLCMDTEGK